MTYADCLAKMRALADDDRSGRGDPEFAHAEADKLLCAFLRDSGFGELIDAYDRIEKWYA